MFKVNYKSLVLFAVVFFATLFSGGKFLYGLLIFTIAVILFSFLSGKWFYNNLVNIVWKGSGKVHAGDSVVLESEFYHSGLLPVPYIKVNSHLSKRLTGEEEKSEIYAIRPGSKVMIKKNILCKHKGAFRIGFVEVEFSDIFGLFHWKKVFDNQVTLYVYPKITVLKHLDIPMRQHFGTVHVRHNAYEDFASIKDIRKYAAGDSLKRVHWKVTSHRGEMHVKNVELNASADVNIFWDLHAAGYDNAYCYELEDKGAECAASIIHFVLSKNMSCSLIGKGERFVYVSGSGAAKLNSFLDVITNCESTGDMPVWDLLRKETSKLNLGATAIIITPYMDDSAMDVLFQLKRSGIDPVIIFLCSDRTNPDKRVQALRENDFRIHIVSLTDDIRHILGGAYEKQKSV